MQQLPHSCTDSDSYSCPKCFPDYCWGDALADSSTNRYSYYCSYCCAHCCTKHCG